MHKNIINDKIKKKLKTKIKLYMLDRLWWHNDTQQSNERKESSPEHMKDFLDTLNRSKETIKKCKLEEAQNRKGEEEELDLCEEVFNWNLDIDDYDTKLQELKEKKESPPPNLPLAGEEIFSQKETQEFSEKEKVIRYAKISELAYWEYETSSSWTVELTKVNLDPLSFPNIKNLLTTPPDKLTPDEQTLLTFIKENKDNYDLDYKIDNNISGILKLAWINTTDNQVASLSNNISSISREEQLMVAWLLEQRQEKTSETTDYLQKLQKDFKITDSYPSFKDRDTSWFQAIALEDKNWNKYISIAGTQLTDFWDIWADIVMWVGHIPINQTIDLIKFIERNTNDWEKLKIMWHSLGWALSQIATAMYEWQVEETYTFNSPWVRELEAYIQVIEKELNKDESLSEQDKELIIAKFKEFWYNEDSNKIVYDKENAPGSELITNVAWIKWPSATAKLWEDIWDYSIELKELKSHKIRILIEYVERLRENSDELIKKEKIYIDSDTNERE